tara:strand:+ start:1454 stop:1654 length:201 start_codon:yes stop_codon:yes gene_type:complete
MDLLREVIYEQNKDLLRKIAEDFYSDMKTEQIDFIYKYNKKNFTYMQPVKKDLNKINEKKINKILK